MWQVRFGRVSLGLEGRDGVARQVWRALAVWRLTELIVEDQVSRPFRDAIANRWPGTPLAYLVTCKRCVSVWAAAVVLLIPAWLCEALALSSVTIWLNDWRDDQASAALARRMSRGRVRREGETG